MAGVLSATDIINGALQAWQHFTSLEVRGFC